MEGKIIGKGNIFFCRSCGNLDYANGKSCSKCGSLDIEIASQDITFDNNSHDHLMKVIYAEHEKAYFKSKDA